jgi:hypothetical protein
LVPSSTAAAPTTAIASAGAIGSGALHGFSNPGGILSPLMLITIAALPTAKDQQDDEGHVARHGAVGFNRHIGQQFNPVSALG